ncbi:uncharacterized protein LOC107478264 [Arachis duranensis]|uniref:Uncharacterized protein LOC107478264 n=1 Tax=Arachis duranensis TaxID=130453 RepID=A0A6P4CRY6_ARADU|nr:uncharacterized protein LOC107478264 [Arachis duranensis]
MWVKNGGLDLIDLVNEYFVARLYNEDDYWHVMEGGPWLLFNHYLTIQRWTSDFHLFGAEINKVDAWVQLPDLPIEYYEKRFLGKVGDQIGKTLKVALNTANQARGKFARLCVELDLSKLLDAKYLVNGVTYHIEYEGLHMICFSCGMFGHISDGCMSKTMEREERGVQVQKQPEAVEEEGSQQQQLGHGESIPRDKEAKKDKKTIGRKRGKWYEKQGDKAKDIVEAVGGNSRYEVLTEHSNVNDENMNSQATLLRNTPQEMTKEFLNENQMRRAKVQANCNHMEQNCLKIAST